MDIHINQLAVGESRLEPSHQFIDTGIVDFVSDCDDGNRVVVIGSNPAPKSFGLPHNGGHSSGGQLVEPVCAKNG